jgi:hypothetical protein
VIGFDGSTSRSSRALSLQAFPRAGSSASPCSGLFQGLDSALAEPVITLPNLSLLVITLGGLVRGFGKHLVGRGCRKELCSKQYVTPSAQQDE